MSESFVFPIPKRIANFQTVNERLKKNNIKFHDESNPLKMILEYNNGYYFMPTFYGLMSHLRMKSSLLVEHLRGMVDGQFHNLLDRIKLIDEKKTYSIASQFGITTIEYCGHNLHPNNCSTLEEKLQILFNEMKHSILERSSSFDDIVEMLDDITRVQFPNITLCDHDTLPNERYYWNAIQNVWQKVQTDQDVVQLVTTVWEQLKQFILSEDSSKKDLFKNEPPAFLRLFFSRTSPVYLRRSAVYKDYWVLQTYQNDILDLLSGHVGGMVPDHNIVSKEQKLSIQLDPRDLHLLHNLDECECLWRMYDMMVCREFFDKYLKACSENVTNDLTDTLRETLCKELGETMLLSSRAEPMLQFFVHLCKYASFNYDNVWSLLDMLACLLMTCKDASSFFVLRGTNTNGKSTLLQMIERVYGTYCSRIKPLANSDTACKFDSAVWYTHIVMLDGFEQIDDNLINNLSVGAPLKTKTKIFISTTLPSITDFEDWVEVIPFEATFSDNAPETTNKQVEKNCYPVDKNQEALVENCHKGLFLLTYFYFIDHMDGCNRQ